MPLYRYTASDPAAAALQRGEITADSGHQVRAALRRMGLTPLRVDALASSRPRRGGDRAEQETAGAGGAEGGVRQVLSRSLSRWRQGRRRAALVECYESLGTLLATGTELSAALALLAPQSAPMPLDGARRPARTSSAAAARIAGAWLSERGGGVALSRLAAGLAERVRGGDSLAEAMEAQPGWFGQVDIAVVRAGEQAGELSRALADLAEHHGRREEVSGRLAATLAYPALLLLFGLGVVVFLSTTTIPQLAAVLRDAGADLPRPTRILLTVGETLAGRWWLILLLSLPAVAALSWAWNSRPLARWRLRVPLIGRAALRGQVGSLSVLLARLLECGVPLAEALALVLPTIRNPAIAAELGRVRAALLAGRPVTEELRAGGVFEPVFCRVLEVAEQSGELAGALRTIGQRMSASSRRLVDRLGAVLEPAVILLLAAMIGFVVYAAIAPMLKIAQTL